MNDADLGQAQRRDRVGQRRDDHIGELLFTRGEESPIELFATLAYEIRHAALHLFALRADLSFVRLIA